jgi:hypothetical protein
VTVTASEPPFDAAAAAITDAVGSPAAVLAEALIVPGWEARQRRLVEGLLRGPRARQAGALALERMQTGYRLVYTGREIATTIGDDVVVTSPLDLPAPAADAAILVIAAAERNAVDYRLLLSDTTLEAVG